MTETIDLIKHTIAHSEHVAAPSVAKPAESTAVSIASAFCKEMQAAFTAQDADAIVGLFTPDGWWRDILVSRQRTPRPPLFE